MSCTTLLDCSSCVGNSSCIWATKLNGGCCTEGNAYGSTSLTGIGNDYNYATCVGSAPVLIISMVVLFLVVLPGIAWASWKYRKSIKAKYKAARGRIAERRDFFSMMDGMGSRWQPKNGKKTTGSARTGAAGEGLLTSANVGKKRGWMDKISTAKK